VASIRITTHVKAPFAIGPYPGSFRGELKELVRIAEREA